MIFNYIIKSLLMVLFGITIFSISLCAKDANILVYKDRGIKYYPRYVSKGLVKIGKASWYGKQFHKRLTASGERYNMYSMTAAHRTYALNTILKVTNLSNKKSVRVRVNDRGPFYRSRDIDLSYGAAKKIGLTKKGVGRVKIEVISSARKAHNKRGYRGKYQRRYRVQLASFFKRKYANIFKKKHKLKHVQIVPKYIKSKRKTAYRVIVKCTPWEAKQFIKSKKFNGAYIIS
jgi:rare lipoprotein A